MTSPVISVFVALVVTVESSTEAIVSESVADSAVTAEDEMLPAVTVP